MFLDKRGSKARLHEFTTAANKILYNSGQDQVVGVKFVPCFLERCPDFLEQKQKSISVARKNAHNIDALQGHVHEYKDLRKEYNILDINTWNFDETRFRLGVG